VRADITAHFESFLEDRTTDGDGGDIDLRRV
jgi:hypothetical protein